MISCFSWVPSPMKCQKTRPAPVSLVGGEICLYDAHSQYTPASQRNHLNNGLAEINFS